MLKSFTVAAVAALAAVSAQADVVVSSFPQWDNSSGIIPTGTPRLVFGQRFTAPAGVTTLDAFATRISFTAGAVGQEVMRMYVYAMSGNNPVGTALFRSDPIVRPEPFSGMNVAVTPGLTYSVLFSDAEMASHTLLNVTFASTFNSSASSPFLVDAVSGFINAAPGNTNPLSGITISTALAPRDLIVEMTFAPGPAPLSIAAMGALALSRRRR